MSHSSRRMRQAGRSLRTQQGAAGCTAWQGARRLKIKPEASEISAEAPGNGAQQPCAGLSAGEPYGSETRHAQRRRGFQQDDRGIFLGMNNSTSGGWTTLAAAIMLLRNVLSSRRSASIPRQVR